MTYTTTKQCESLDRFGWALAIIFNLKVAEPTQLDSLHTEVLYKCWDAFYKLLYIRPNESSFAEACLAEGNKGCLILIKKSPDLYFCIVGASLATLAGLLEMTFLCYTKRMGWE